MNGMRAVGWLRGKVQFTAQGGAYERLLNRCSGMGLTLAGVQPIPGGVKGWVPLRDYKKIYKAARHCHCRVRICKKRGLPFLLHRYRGRWGLVLGAALFAGLCLYLPGLVWCVRYYQLPQPYQQEISALLQAGGIYPGCRPSPQQLGRVQQMILLQSQGLAEVSLNFVKGRLIVEASGRTGQPQREEKPQADLVAARAGYIERMDVAYGFAAVAPGQWVEPGELLVTGVYLDEKTRNIITTPVKAQVIARTQRRYEVRQPLTFRFSRLTGESVQAKTLVVGSFRLPLGRQPETDPAAEQQVRYEQLSFLGFALPAGIETRTSYRREEADLTLTPEQAQARADMLLAQALAQSGAAELLSAGYQGVWQGEEYVATLTVELLEDIAQAAGG